jgi:glucose/arabinose dehydrogenase
MQSCRKELNPKLLIGLPLLISIILFNISFQSKYYVQGAINEQFEPKRVEGLPTINDNKLKVEMVFKGLQFPTSMDFLGPNDVLVTEKNNGTVQRLTNWKMQPAPVLDVNVATRAERGMLGIAIAKNNQSEKIGGENSTNVFVYFTRSSEAKDTDGVRGEKSGGNALYRYELIDSKLSNPHLLLELSPRKHPSHNGGAIIIGQDENLYIPVGDGDGDTTEAQNIIGGGAPNGTGGILTMNQNQNGSSMQNILGNSGILGKYYAYGVRNSFGLDFDPISGKLWDTENGNKSGDEINLVEPGFNSGWKVIQGKAPADFNYSQLVNFDGKGKYSDPEFSWTETVGPTKIKFLNSDKLGKSYENDMLVSDIKNGRIYHFDLNEKRDSLVLGGNLTDKVANSDQELNDLIFGSGFAGITDMDIGPDGYLYVLDFGNGAIFKISPK